MEQYKFRAWHREAKVMLEEEQPGDVFKWLNEGQPLDIMLYNGDKDTNGKVMCEGDIVSFHTYSTYYPQKGKRPGKPKIEVVELGSDCWYPFCDPTYTEDEQGDWFTTEDPEGRIFTIIGNIYENPELLK